MDLDTILCEAQDNCVSEIADLVTGAEAAEILGVDPSTVSRWSSDDLRPESRKLTAVGRLRGQSGYKLFRRSEVEALAAELAETRS